MTRPLLLASRSPGKLREIRGLLAEAGRSMIDLEEAGIPEGSDEESIEAFSTFEENALAKARHFHVRSGGLATIADDSGLVVESLGGAPGVHSKRWSTVGGLASGFEAEDVDAANNAALLAALRERLDRDAHYVCVAAYVDGSLELVARGETHGRILTAPRGGGGFGYDPLFWSAELSASFGESTREEKAKISHRARAFRALCSRLTEADGFSVSRQCRRVSGDP